MTRGFWGGPVADLVALVRTRMPEMNRLRRWCSREGKPREGESMLAFSGLGSLPRNSKQRRMRGPSLYMTPVEISILMSIRPTAGRTDLQ